MPVIYHDWINGSDAIGDGSNINPYKTFNAAKSVASPGDEIRCAKTPFSVHTVDCTWVYGSKEILTSSSMVGIISVNEHVCKPTGGGNGNHETVYRVQAVAADRISIFVKYTGESETTSEIKQIIPVPTGVTNPVAMPESIEYSGGWNLTTETIDGETWINSLAPSSSVSAISVPETSILHHMNSDYGERGVSVYGECYNVTSVRGRYSTFRIYEGSRVFNCVAVDTDFSTTTYPTFEIIGAPIVLDNNFATSRELICDVLPDFTLPDQNSTNYFIGGTRGIRFRGAARIGKAVVKDSAVYGVSLSTAGAIAANCEISGSAAGVFIESQTHVNCIIRKCLISNCQNGITTQNAGGCLLEECKFKANGNDLVTSQYARPVLSVNCVHDSPVNYAYNLVAGCGTVTVVNATIDEPSIGKAFFVPSVSMSSLFPALVLQNSFGGQSGAIYNSGSMMIDESTVSPGTSTPSLKFMYFTTNNTTVVDFKIGSAFVKGGLGKKVSVWYKTDPAWSGSVTPKAKLNGVLVETGPAIQTPTGLWTKIEFSLLSGVIDRTGEISLEIEVVANNTPIWFGDFKVEGL